MNTKKYLARQQARARERLIDSAMRTGDLLDQRCGLRQTISAHPWLSLAAGWGGGLIAGRVLGAVSGRTGRLLRLARPLAWGIYGVISRDTGTAEAEGR